MGSAKIAPGRARRLVPAARRSQLLACAIEVFARRGIGEARHGEIASEAGVSVATVFFYFPTREELINQVLAEVERFYVEMLEQISRQKLPAPRLLLKYAAAFADSIDTHRGYAQIFLEWSVAVRGRIWERYLGFQDRIVAILKRTICSGQREGTVARDLDPEDDSLLVMSAAHTIAQLKLLGCPAERVDRFLNALVRSAIGARPSAVARGDLLRSAGR